MPERAEYPPTSLTGKTLEFDAVPFARAWLSVAVASGADKDRPALNRTISIETYPAGVRIVATDSYLLLRSWVPTLSDPDAAEPDLDEAPDATAVAMDLHGRAKGFLAHLLNLGTAGDDPDLYTLSLEVLALDVDPDRQRQATIDGLDARYVVLDEADSERLRLPIYDGPYPEWRRVLPAFARARTEAIALNPELIGRLGKLAKWHGPKPLLWRFGGPDKMACVEIAEGYPAVAGVDAGPVGLRPRRAPRRAGRCGQVSDFR